MKKIFFTIELITIANTLNAVEINANLKEKLLSEGFSINCIECIIQQTESLNTQEVITNCFLQFKNIPQPPYLVLEDFPQCEKAMGLFNFNTMKLVHSTPWTCSTQCKPQTSAKKR